MITPVLALSLALFRAPTTYTFIGIGPTSAAPSARPSSIGPSGWVTGGTNYHPSSSNMGPAFSWTPFDANATALPGLGGYSVGNDVDASGTVVGWSSNRIGRQYAVLWKAGTLTQVCNTWPSACISVNSSGRVLFLGPTKTSGNMFVWQNGKTSALNTGRVDGYQINDYGTVTVRVGDTAAFWRPSTSNGNSGTVYPLGLGNTGQAIRINNTGEIVTLDKVWTPSAPNAATGTLSTFAPPANPPYSGIYRAKDGETTYDSVTLLDVNDAGIILGRCAHHLVWTVSGTSYDSEIGWAYFVFDPASQSFTFLTWQVRLDTTGSVTSGTIPPWGPWNCITDTGGWGFEPIRINGSGYILGNSGPGDGSEAPALLSPSG